MEGEIKLGEIESHFPRNAQLSLGSLNELQTDHLYQECMWTLLYPSTVNKGKTLTLGHWLAEQNMCLTPASRPLLHWVLGTHTGSALFHQTLRPLPWALFPGHHSDITTTSLIGWLPTVQDRWCIFSPSLVALCMLLPSGSRPHSVSRVR